MNQTKNLKNTLVWIYFIANMSIFYFNFKCYFLLVEHDLETAPL